MKRGIAMIMTAFLVSGLIACGGSSSGTGDAGTASGQGAQEGTAAAADADKKDLVIGVAAEAVTLDPQAGWDGNSLFVMHQLYNQLVKLDDKMNIVPDLADSWEQVDDTTVTFKLRQGVHFHNGEEMKASDVVYSLQRAQQSAKVKAFTANIASVTADDDYTVTIKTSIPYAPLMSNLTHTACSIVSRKAAEAAGDNFSQAPVGTGPFAFDSWASGDRIVLKKNEDYFGGEVKPDSLTIKLMSEGSARTIALETGEIDFEYPVPASDAARVDGDQGENLVVSMSPKIEYVSMNQKVEPFNNQKVRQAINYAIDKESLNTVATNGYGVVKNSQITGYTDEVTHYEHNPEKAKELLAEAGYPNGFSTDILVYGDTRNTEAQLIQANLAEVGITATITSEESTTMLEQINNGNYQMFIMSYNNTTGDPDTSLYMLFNSKVPASSGNRSYTSIPEVDELLEKGRSSINADERKDIYKQIQQILTDQAVWVPLYDVPNLFGLRSGLNGFAPHPLGNDVFNELSYQQ